ncbi:MAG TPA: sugar transferase, partial [Flavobacteriales bacterium]|nr:sugar transferase [Flavobacteriales bacterium]
MNRRLQVAKYVLTDLIGSGLAWTLFFVYRKMYLEPVQIAYSEITFDENYFKGLILIPLFWFGLYTVVGGYREIFRRFRTKELGQTLLISFIGVTVIFFVLLLDDDVAGYKLYYRSFLALFLLHFTFTFIPRFLLTSSTVSKVHRREIAFNTILIGGNERAMAIYDEIEGLPKSPGNKFVGFVNVNGGDQLLAEVGLPRLGKWNELRTVIDQHAVEEAIIAVDSGEHAHISKIMNELDGTHIRIKVIPDMYDILSGSVKMTSIFGAPLIEVNPEIMPAWQFSLKRSIDIAASAIAMVVLSPVYLIIGITVWSTSRGPMFFSQERIGKYGRPFKIIKFRSMISNAE